MFFTLNPSSSYTGKQMKKRFNPEQNTSGENILIYWKVNKKQKDI